MLGLKGLAMIQGYSSCPLIRNKLQGSKDDQHFRTPADSTHTAGLGGCGPPLKLSSLAVLELCLLLVVAPWQSSSPRLAGEIQDSAPSSRWEDLPRVLPGPQRNDWETEEWVHLFMQSHDQIMWLKPVISHTHQWRDVLLHPSPSVPACSTASSRKSPS